MASIGNRGEAGITMTRCRPGNAIQDSQTAIVPLAGGLGSATYHQVPKPEYLPEIERYQNFYRERSL
jgi:hypothetical protein